jgi:mannose-6-phosphate isomerase-like protein (cupin superfamily)
MEAKDKAYVINTKDITPGVAPLHFESNSWCPVINDDIEVYVTEIRPGGRAEKDNHPDSDHVFYYTSGFGYQICDGQRFDVGPGDFLFVPRGVDHEMYVTGQETLRMVVTFSPCRDMKKPTLTFHRK